MEKQAYDRLYEVEEKHWYHNACGKLVEIYLEQIKEETPNRLDILEIGCGTGGMLDVLGKYGKVTGLEISNYALNLCKKRHPEINLINGSANNLKMLFKENSFDVVTFFNVLYHKDIESDIDVLRDTHYILKLSGYVIGYEPAFKCLYRNNDKICHGIRRYTKNQIKDIMDSVGFQFVGSTYFNLVSFSPILLVKFIEKIKKFNKKKEVIELKLPSKIVNCLLNQIMFLERLWIKFFKRVPFGSSLLYIGRKG